MNHTWPHKTFKTLAILLPLVFAFAVAQDIYIPAVPQLVGFFHTTSSVMQLSLTCFMAAFGLGQLFMGPLADQFGRKKIALMSTFAYAVSSFLCAMSQSVEELIVLRSVEAISSCGMMVCAMAIVRDVFNDENQSAKIYSYLNGAIAFSPLLAPVLGGYLDVYFGWRSCFIALVILGVIGMVIIVLHIKETHLHDKRTKINREIFKRYLTIFKHKDFQFYGFAGAAGVSCLFSFFSISPYLLINSLGVSRDHFGFYFAVMGLLFFMGSVISGRIVGKMGIQNNILIGAILILSGGLAMFGWFKLTGLSRAGLIVPMVPISLGGAFLIGAGAAGAMAPFGAIAGTAAALFCAGEFLIPAGVGTVMMQLSVNSTIPLSLVALMLGAIMLLWWFKRGI